MLSRLILSLCLHTSVVNMETVGISKSLPKYTYEQLRNAIKRQDAVIIDVREPSELRDTGEIPGSINIPVGQVEHVFSNTDETQFKTHYGIEKPKKDSEIIVSCRSGRRSELAQTLLMRLGFNKVYNYAGGWLDWEKHLKCQK